ncbi:copper resistance system multicopper oxidase [Paracoccus sp. 1_MG-2023]|uniref:copper resistance system multicopper oxidase n=1 Tax=unclassified Paracoccus (in: a-proteobacteria) TaxID=2688777 RepID=UPI001C0A1485|nr:MULTISPECIES: copper resistance system multicopper oxidase [unclassified Paracoccus (in: a-proteobacteria)]MBU2959165.1 copper resistance system multicopper oxidase [Paracoccus sp. C2R09]MDO6670098.1 copper resistance system multicopper oxidase [Paracoccus sp. 1_MG-2023]
MRHITLLRSLAVVLGLGLGMPAQADTYDISVDKIRIDTGGFAGTGIGYNGRQTPTVLHFQEGEDVVIRVKNNLRESTSIHWHGLILPFRQDGVPGISFNGIRPGETFTYRFPIRQAGTYWFHSHSGFQEPDGAYGAIVISPRNGETVRADRDYVVQLTDKHPHSGSRIFRNLKASADYYNRAQRTAMDLIEEAGAGGLKAAMQDRRMWGAMRMMPTDIEDVQGYAPLINGASTQQNWTGMFKPGEKVRLRLINSSASTYFDIRVPGLKMTVVQADGNDVKPVTVDELRIGVAETYDVIVEPREAKAYSIIGESVGRTAMVRGTLAPAAGMVGPYYQMRPQPLLTMADMGGMMSGKDHSGMDMGGMDMSGMDHSGMDMGSMDMSGMNMGGGIPVVPSEGAPGAAFYAPGSGLIPTAANGGRFLGYEDLTARRPLYRDRAPTREIEIRLTGNMERYIWSINGVKYEDAEPIRLQYGERVRFKFVNETMMAHPMHLHGMWSIVDTGMGALDPVKHTVSVAPGTTLYTETEVDAPGQWAFHCHLSYHMAGGMFRKVIVEGGPA